jgi:hypothetical protein
MKLEQGCGFLKRQRSGSGLARCGIEFIDADSWLGHLVPVGSRAIRNRGAPRFIYLSDMERSDATNANPY